MAVVHRLKTIDAYFDAIADGRKLFEVRRNDRGFQTGDIVELNKVWGPGSLIPGCDVPAAPTLRMKITYLLQGGQFGIEPGYCVLGLKPEASI